MIFLSPIFVTPPPPEIERGTNPNRFYEVLEELVTFIHTDMTLYLLGYLAETIIPSSLDWLDEMKMVMESFFTNQSM